MPGRKRNARDDPLAIGATRTPARFAGSASTTPTKTWPRRALAAGTTVTSVSYRWGFSDPSHLAPALPAAYGTTPSDTLRN